MKTFLSFFSLFLIAGAINAQIVFEKQYNKYEVCPRIISPGVYKYIYSDEENYKIYLYNLDHTLYKEITIPPVTVPAGYEPFYATDITQFLFNTDNKFEYTIGYQNYVINKRIYKVLNEDGIELFSDSICPSIYPKGNNKFVMVVTTSNYTKIYSVPGIDPTATTQTLSLSNDTLYLTEGGQVYLGYLATGTKSISLNEAYGLGKTYPNPTQSLVSVNYLLPAGESTGYISVLNQNGAEVKKVPVTDDIKSSLVDFSGLSSGTYYVQLKTESGFSGAKKIIKIE